MPQMPDGVVQKWGQLKSINYSLWGCEYICTYIYIINIYIYIINIIYIYIIIYIHSIRISMAARDMLLLLKFGFRVYDSRSKSRKSI